MPQKWKIGDKIGGIYEIREIHGGEGKSGMGVVYICHYRWHQKLYALKTYQDRFAISERLTGSFYKEAMLWMGIENHPNIVQAHWVHQFDGRIYIVMEYIPPDNLGRLTLSTHMDKPLPLLRSLIWGIQFCYGMEYANSKGIKVHRDIKPYNILITLDKTLKITDFGLSKAFDEKNSQKGGMAGTPYWMSPEQFDDAENCTVKSDIYSFGVVLYQMASGGLPFKAPVETESDFLKSMYALHKSAPIPRLDSVMSPIIDKCMAKNPEDRYQDFKDLREAIESLWQENTDIPMPKPLVQKPFGFKEINQKGVALKHLGKPAQAIEFHSKAIDENPVFPNAWNDKGIALWELENHSEALECFRKAMEIDHEFVHPINNRAGLLNSLGKHTEAIEFYEQGLKIDPDFIYFWKGKGDVCLKLNRHTDAIGCYDEALRINSKDSWAWYKKGLALYASGDPHEALEYAETAIEINPFLYQAYELINIIKGAGEG